MIEMTEHSAWLKRMDHGAIGEARSKAFLMDRFWILERSVDIDGADLIIQRKITGFNLLDKEPPRLGVVQVKFYYDRNTTHYIHKEYLVDNNNEERSEFFLICHTGFESEAQIFLLSAKELVENFEIASVGHSREGRYIIPGRKLLDSDEFKVTSPKLSLDRIERAIKLSTFKKNRQFLSWALPSAAIKDENILPVYLEPIDNWWGDIPKAFREMKEKAQSFLFELDDVYSQFKEIVETSDPEQALEISEDIEAYYRGGTGAYLSMPDDLYDEDFQTVVKEHKNKCATIKKLGILDSFIEFKLNLLRYISSDLGPKQESTDKDVVYEIRIKYNPTNLKIDKITSAFIPADKYWKIPLKKNRWGSLDVPKTSNVIFFINGNAIVYWLPSRFGYVDKKDDESWQEFYSRYSPYPISDLMQKLYDFIIKKHKS
jgi:hypothetical protein